MEYQWVRAVIADLNQHAENGWRVIAIENGVALMERQKVNTNA